jgi:hypothetical protein
MENNSNEFTINSLDPKEKKLALLKQELDVNLQQQAIVNKKLNLIKEVLKNLPNTTPEYAILLTQLEMEQIDLDELKYREEELKSKIKYYS